ncbi:chemotaxis protein CheW [Comamonas sp. Y33R10-2]|uniref:chemotaxis protein CheW n=1 Tax=Comamonas sp. Y33R10-2 TaxID=2853257 RepID=UPI002107DCDF|nr:chemotaxis protein CheW [Comamonas sp. Y33R10-2]
MPQKKHISLAQYAQDTLQIDSFIAHMRQVARCESSLQELSLMWRLIESSAKMNCPQEAQALLPMMAATRTGFEQLEQDLVQSMVAQAVEGVSRGLHSQAQHLMDTLVRNLYERTADVGFLATDVLLCRFMAGLDGHAPADKEQITQRLRAYRSKYTVYQEVLLLDCEGHVQASTQGTRAENSAASRLCRDPLIAQALQSQSFVQVFGATDLLPNQPSGLIYAHRMLHPVTQQPVGVLCLCFDFEGEMQGLWDERASAGGDEADTSIALLLDAQGQVLASSDRHWIGVGLQLKPHKNGANPLLTHGGRTYLVQSEVPAGYQGYMGPQGWRAQMMVPIELAFGTQGSSALQGVDAVVAQGLLAHAHRFCPPLHAISSAADTIRRVVWNGQAMSAGKQADNTRLQAVLEQIGETGARTNEVFTQSIRSLYSTVLATALRDNSLLTRLLVGLLDRNLYERANDCRWWALTPQLPALLQALKLGKATEGMSAEACELLTAIHALYTVYQQIVVYDAHGKIVAASLAGGAQDDLIGHFVERETLLKVQALQGAQAYYVSPWSPSDLQATGEPTYVYHAAIRSCTGEVLGGIGLIFHAQREFEAMLQGVLGTQADKRDTSDLPAGGAGASRQVAFFNRSGVVMSSSSAQILPGSVLDLPADMLTLSAGQSLARAMAYQGQYCVVAVTAGSGYREFKRSDGYEEEVLALSVQAFGPVQDDAQAAVWRRSTRVQSLPSAMPTTGENMEMATFFVGNSVLAVDAACVLEAQSAADIAPVSAGRLPHCVGTLARRSQGVVAGYVWVFDLSTLLYGKPLLRSAQSQVIVLEHQGLRLGLLVSDLEGVVRLQAGQMRRAPALAHMRESLVESLIQANDGDLLIQCLNVAALVAMLKAPAQVGVTY